MDFNLMYHCVLSKSYPLSGFQNETAQEYKIDRKVFKSHLNFLIRKKVSINFTFDDGGSSFYFVIADLLEEFGFRGIFFISTAYIGTPGFLSINQLVELHRRGHLIGSHSHSHYTDLTVLDREVIYNDWKVSVDLLERWLGDRVTIASIPNGHSSRKVLKAARDSGILKLYDSKPTTTIRKFEGMEVHGRFALRKGDEIEVLELIYKSRLYRTKKLIRYILLDLSRKILGKYYFLMNKSVKVICKKW